MFTPGPWDIYDKSYGQYVIMGCERYIASSPKCSETTYDYERSYDGNARLISQAPNMFEILKNIKLALDPYDDEERYEEGVDICSLFGKVYKEKEKIDQIIKYIESGY